MRPAFRDITLANGVDRVRHADHGAVGHGAHVGEGPVLAILAMLARKSALRVAPGGSAPPMPLRCAP
jgi:hypothetical protein